MKRTYLQKGYNLHNLRKLCMMPKLWKLRKVLSLHKPCVNCVICTKYGSLAMYERKKAWLAFT